MKEIITLIVVSGIAFFLCLLGAEMWEAISASIIICLLTILIALKS